MSSYIATTSMATAARNWLLFMATALLAACGGESQTTAGIDRLGVSNGTINGFGSIIVSGIRYEVPGDCRIELDGTSGTEADLRVGQDVVVRWESDDDSTSRRCHAVLYSSAVKGPVSSINLQADSLVVLGQTVQVTSTTLFDANVTPRNLDGLAVDDIVEVSGKRDAAGAIIATRIERKPPGIEFKVRGKVADLDVISSAFRLGDLVVDFSVAELPDEPVTNDAQVEVVGTVINGAGQFVATRVSFDSVLGGFAASGEEVELEGYITRFVSATDFDIAGQPVTTTATTEYDDGSVTDLGLNILVEVEGRVDAQGVLVAEEVEFESDVEDGVGEARVSGQVTAVDSGSDILRVLGVDVTVTAQTLIVDVSETDLSPFGLGDINPGDYVEVRGMQTGVAAMVAAVIERDDPTDIGSLRGPASNIVQPGLDVLGIAVIADESTQYFSDDDDDNELTAAQFFSALGAGEIVTARFSLGAQPGGAIVAARLELEEADDDD